MMRNTNPFHHNELDEAELRVGFRKLYKDEGVMVCIRVVHELAMSARILKEIILEEAKKEKNALG